MATFDDFLKLDVRTGVIVEVNEFPEARKPAYKLKIDFGKEIGIKNSSAQLTGNYAPTDLVNKTVLAVVNFPPRQIGPFLSEVLVLGLPDEAGHTVLVAPERQVNPGARLY